MLLLVGILGLIIAIRVIKKSTVTAPTMEECVGSVVSRIVCILTYGGGGKDIAINYALLTLNTI